MPSLPRQMHCPGSQREPVAMVFAHLMVALWTVTSDRGSATAVDELTPRYWWYWLKECGRGVMDIFEACAAYSIRPIAVSAICVLPVGRSVFLPFGSPETCDPYLIPVVFACPKTFGQQESLSGPRVNVSVIDFLSVSPNSPLHAYIRGNITALSEINRYDILWTF